MMHSALLPGFSTVHGAGVIAIRDVPIGTAVWWPCPRCPAVELDRLPLIPQSVLDWMLEYGYRRADDGMLVPCNGAHLFNHSCDAAVLHYGLAVGITVRALRRGDEVTCDYREFMYEDPWSFECGCGTPECVGVVRSTSGRAPEALVSDWTTRIDVALAASRTVPQEVPVVGGDVHSDPGAEGQVRS